MLNLRVLRLSGCVLALAALLGACGGGDDAPLAVTSPPPADTLPPSGLVPLDASTSCNLPEFKATLLQQINAARATARSCGADAMPATAALAWNDRLFSAAARHADDMARQNYFSHTGRDGRSPAQRVSAEGYSWRTVGENIAAGQPAVSEVMASWLASPGHCLNIMRAEYTEVGVACVVAPSGSTYSRYWAMNLARP